MLNIHRMANQVQTCLLNLQSITCQSSAISYWTFTASQAHEVWYTLSSASHLLSVPWHHLSFDSHTFCISSPKIWNSLPVPPHILQSQTLSHVDVI